MNCHELPEHTSVALISMPWGSVLEPNLGLGILKTLLRHEGIGCDVFEAIPRMLRWMKYDTYDRFGATWALNEFLFTREFEPEISAEQLELARRIVTDDQDIVRAYSRNILNPEEELKKIVKLRQEIIPAFLDDLMDSIDFSKYCLVGFTCLFDQTWASLALAKRIKERFPSLTIAFGGYGVEKPTGPALQRVMPQMDVVAYGDGEPTIVPLVKACCGLCTFDDVPNISFRNGDEVRFSATAPVKIDLADSPVPNYDDWFRNRQDLIEKYHITINVGEMPLESSRGCWWGQKHHCTFCGIDEITLRYRKKPAEAIIEQLDLLHERYGAHTFRFSDYIMPMSHFNDFLKIMANRGAPYWLHYETKANLTPEQVRLASQGGVYYLQPGIESFSTPILKAMDKGVTGIQNVAVIYNMMKNNIFCYYNIIFGFPGDQADEYWAMVKNLPLLYHLLPPGSTTYPMVVRHAPMQNDPVRFGAKTNKVTPHWRYQVMFSNDYLARNHVPFDDYVYYFNEPDNYRQFDENASVSFKALQHQQLLWGDRYNSNKTRLSFEVKNDSIEFCDNRTSKQLLTRTFEGAGHALMYPLLAGRTWREAPLLSTMAEHGISEESSRRILRDFSKAGLIYQEDNSYLGIAFEVTYYNTQPTVRHRWWEGEKSVLRNRAPSSLDFPDDRLFGRHAATRELVNVTSL